MEAQLRYSKLLILDTSLTFDDVSARAFEWRLSLFHGNPDWVFHFAMLISCRIDWPPQPRAPLDRSDSAQSRSRQT